MLEWNLLIGAPGEKTEVYQKYLKDIPLLTHLPPPLGAFPVEFVRFSHYFDNASQYKLELRPHDFCRMTYPFNDNALMNIARRFVDDNLDQENQNLWLDKLNSMISTWQARWLGNDGKIPANEIIRMIVPVRDRRADSSLNIEVQVHANDSLESAGRRLTLFTRLIDQHDIAGLSKNGMRYPMILITGL